MVEINILCELTTMHEDLRDKKAKIYHSEVPQDLLKNPRRQRTKMPSDTSMGLRLSRKKLPKRQDKPIFFLASTPKGGTGGTTKSGK